VICIGAFLYSFRALVKCFLTSTLLPPSILTTKQEHRPKTYLELNGHKNLINDDLTTVKSYDGELFPELMASATLS
jgi:hypothetical protein